MRLLWLAPLLFATGCSIKTDERHQGSGAIAGNVEGLSLTCSDGVSIARSFPPSTEIKVAPGGVSCETVRAGDHLTIDLGDSQPGTYQIVKGYPMKADLSPGQARAHACPDEGTSPCHDMVRSGTVVITRFDGDVGGRVEGTFEVTFADGEVSGSFSAIRCN